MAVLERTTHDLSFAERRATLFRAVDQENQDLADALLDGITNLVTDAVAARDVEAIALLRAQIARLMRRIPQDRRDGVAPLALRDLERLDGVLDRGRVAVLLQKAAEERKEEAGSVRERIARLLEEKAWRPRDLADHLGCDPSQVSRALRELQDEQAVVRVEKADAGADRRAILYATTQAVRAAG